MTFLRLTHILSLSFFVCVMQAQPLTDQVYVDDNGVMRWSADSSEVRGFGVNYTLPFAYEYRMAKKSGIAPEEIIRQDVYHMARLGLDLYRVHVWDTEISDTLGNLISNEHLRLFDFTLYEMSKRGMRFIITPIAYWGNGWPERDEDTPGFSHKYGKEACLTNTAAIEAQANYLRQFMDHVNPYTGVANKDYTAIIGFEVCNEPHHYGSAGQVTSFINKMVAAIREAGCTKPIFYNMSHSINLADAYLDADIQGGTFQWYPANLVAGHQLNGNFLPQVSKYIIPFADDTRFRRMAKIVYEFDPADIGGNIMYPAMAVAFRKAGLQLAAQFAYDAMFNAPYNTNYGTHFMNLAYSPHKAISLKIASALFHDMPLGNESGDMTWPEGLIISYPDDLAVWLTDEEYFYSNNTSARPGDLSQLKEIAGCGSSPVVKYSGSGAYFLDKLGEGMWRLEVMPDVFRIEDPYSPARAGRQKAAVVHNKQTMSVSLPDLGMDFSVTPLNDGNTFVSKAADCEFDIMPGAYILNEDGKNGNINSRDIYNNIFINEYVAPASDLTATVLLNNSPEESACGKSLLLNFGVASPDKIQRVTVIIPELRKSIDATYLGGNSFTAEMPADILCPGFFRYRIIVEDCSGTTAFPGGRKGNPGSWEERSGEDYTIRLVSAESPLVVWDAGADWDYSLKEWNAGVRLIPSDEGGSLLSVKPVYRDYDQKNISRDYAFRFFFKEKIKGRYNELGEKCCLAVKVSGKNDLPVVLEIGLTDKNGTVASAEVIIKHGDDVCRIPFENLKNASYLILPRPFPDFLPEEAEAEDKVFDLLSAETLQVIIRHNDSATGLEIKRIWIE